jgi:Ni,Fe-hydrogenase III component G
MALQKWLDRSNEQPGAPGLRTHAVSLDQWRPVAQDVAAAGGRLLALWASADESGTPTIRAAFLAESNGLVLSAPILHPRTPYPGIGDVFPTALRMQRAIADLTGLRSDDSDTRPWLRHAGWQEGYRPLIDPPRSAPELDAIVEDYPFVRVEGVEPTNNHAERELRDMEKLAQERLGGRTLAVPGCASSRAAGKIAGPAAPPSRAARSAA